MYSLYNLAANPSKLCNWGEDETKARKNRTGVAFAFFDCGAVELLGSERCLEQGGTA